MDYKKTNLLVERLIERTKEGKINWESTANPNIYLAVLSDSSISIEPKMVNKSEFIGFNFAPHYVFDLRNENGDVVESIIVTKKNAEMFQKAEQIYELARDQSLMDDPIVDRILEQLSA